MIHDRRLVAIATDALQVVDSDPILQHWQVEVHHEFASEAPGPAGLPQKNLLALNLRPARIYDDMLKRSSTSGSCWLSGTERDVVAVSIYTGGFECQARGPLVRQGGLCKECS